MKLAIVSDIHGNLTALDAVVADIANRAPDEVVHGGDLALAGAQGAEVVDRIRELGWEGIVGNVDELLWRPERQAEQLRAAPKLRDLLRVLFDEYAPATREALGEERLNWLQELPETLVRNDLTLVHASPGDLWRAPMPDASDDELRETYQTLDARLVVYGHIHRPFVRATVANSGSVGSPFDGDARPSYLFVVDGRAEVVRVEYDVEREADLVLRSGYPDAERIAETRRSGRFVPVRGR